LSLVMFIMALCQQGLTRQKWT